MTAPSYEENRQVCWNNALHAYGTAWWFGERANSYRRKLRAISFLGLLVPVAVGGVVLSFGADIDLKPMLLVAGVISVAQLIWVLWSMTGNWLEAYTTATNSQKKNTEVFQGWEGAARNPPADNSVFAQRIEVLTSIDQMQTSSDLSVGITDKDKRKMMRRGLMQYGRACATCGKKPDSMKTDESCNTCANF